MQALSPNVSEQDIRNFLGGFDFRGERAREPIEPFSGGEKARLALALIVWQRPNLLLLDEPTNHLDLDMRHALNVALQDYEGALIVVSHDRHLLRTTTDAFLIVGHGRARPFDGDLDDYRDWLAEREKAARAAQEAAQAKAAGGPSAAEKREQKRADAETRQRDHHRGGDASWVFRDQVPDLRGGCSPAALKGSCGDQFGRESVDSSLKRCQRHGLALVGLSLRPEGLH